MTLATYDALGVLAARVRAEMHKVMVDMDEVIDALLIALLSGGHLLLEGTPGLGKTYLAKTFAATLALRFKRIQFTSDMLPSDISGSLVFNKRLDDFEFKPGPIFGNVVLADEINRAPPRTQSALLEAMQEKQVTVEGIRYPLPEPFMVVATENPVEQEGTYPLPEAELDRFYFRAYLRFLDPAAEIQILETKQVRGERIDVDAVASEQELKDAIGTVQQVRVDRSLMQYMAGLVDATRHDSRVLLGASPRALVSLLYASKARAALAGRSYVIPDDVKAIGLLTLNHRLILKPEVVAEAATRGELWSYHMVERIVQENILRVEVPR